MINLYDKFNSLNRSIKDVQYPISITGAIKAYYGISDEGCFRISFLSSQNTKLEGTTKGISVVQGEGGDNIYWTCFDLKNDDLLSVFCCFGEDVVSYIERETNEAMAANRLRMRYKTWLALFKKNRTALSEEKAKGLFGELYFIKNSLLGFYEESKVIGSWSGPDKFSKDFALDDTWFEVKTISAFSAIVKISSLQQLSSNTDGYLIVNKVEEMAPTFNGTDSSINSLIAAIVTQLTSNEIKDDFLSKISEYGYDFSDEIGDKKFCVKSVDKYLVDSSFPVLRENDIKSEAVNNVSYELILKLIDSWKKERGI